MTQNRISTSIKQASSNDCCFAIPPEELLLILEPMQGDVHVAIMSESGHTCEVNAMVIHLIAKGFQVRAYPAKHTLTLGLAAISCQNPSPSKLMRLNFDFCNIR